MIFSLLDTYFPARQTLLDAGCGAGTTLIELHRVYPELCLSGCDLNLPALQVAHDRARSLNWFQADVGDLPYRDEFDVILALDVIEHLDDDDLALRSIVDALTPGGGVILTVPQHQFLWSRVDEIGHHRRRYGRGELLQKVDEAGLRVLRTLSYSYLLFPLLLLHRWFDRLPGRQVDEMAELELNPVTNRALGTIMSVENRMSRAGFSAPFGGSLVVVATRAP
jgi:SAM-dependent methyltransferase